MDRKIALLGVVLMVFGAYVVGSRRGAGATDSSRDAGTESSTAASAPDHSGSGGPLGDPVDRAIDGPADGATTPPASSDRAGGNPGAPPTATVTTVEPAEEQTVTIPPSTAWDRRSAAPCDLTFRGYGVVMERWGDVWLPYADGWPTSNPGEVPNCAPDTDFGGAVLAAHYAYLDALRPELISLFAVDGASTSLRIETHPGPSDPATLGYTCAAEGWQVDDDGTYLLYHYCGQSGMKVTRLNLVWEDQRWQLVYPTTGRLETSAAPGGAAYHPFASGD